jgi:hypothetical protein
VAEHCTHVVLESTGNYWKPIFNVLEDSITVVLANAEDVKGRKGHKTDAKPTTPLFMGSFLNFNACPLPTRCVLHGPIPNKLLGIFLSKCRGYSMAPVNAACSRWGESEQDMDTLITTLSIGVFALGTTLCAFFMFFLLRGKPIPGDAGDRQIVKYKDLELGTNSIMLILIISSLVAVSPLALQAWLRSKTPPANPNAPKESTIYISGELRDSTNSAKLAETPLTATIVVTKQKLRTKADQQGHFDFDPFVIPPGANRIKLEVTRDGYLPLEKWIIAD